MSDKQSSDKANAGVSVKSFKTKDTSASKPKPMNNGVSGSSQGHKRGKQGE